MTRLWFQSLLLPDGLGRAACGSTSSRAAFARRGRYGHLTGQRGTPRDRACPGLPNVHSHAFQRGMAGPTEVPRAAATVSGPWRDTMYRFVEAIGRDDLEAIAAFAYMEMLEAGFTRVGEFHYLHHDRGGGLCRIPAEMASGIAAAAQTAGIGLTLLPVFYAHSGFGGAAP